MSSTLLNLFSSYLLLNLLLAILGAASLILLSPKVFKKLKASDLLRLHYLAIALILFFVFARPWFPAPEVYRAPIKVWSGASARDFLVPPPEARSVLAISGRPIARTEQVRSGVVITLTLFSVLMLALFTLEFRRIIRLRRSSHLFRRIGSVELFSNDRVSVPFSYWIPGKATVVVPSALLGSSGHLRTAILHELQHHRQKDTKWIYVARFLQLAGFWNPLAQLGFKKLSEVQEFACDETLVDRSKVSSRAYAGCLVWVAETAARREERLACATGLFFLSGGNILKKRIERMLIKKTEVRRGFAVVIGLGLAVVLAGTGWAAQGLARDRRVSLDQAQQMAANVSSDFPIVVNDLVLEELNRFVGTPSGREFMRKSLERMEEFRPAVEAKIKQYGVPEELMAMPLIETGYRNLPQASQPAQAAGLWQFIPRTARNYGLKVSGEADERLDVTLETDAAMRLLLANKLRFGSWGLSFLAYNSGENFVEDGIRKTGSRDAWTLIRNGFENDKRYLPKVMAAVLILKNPSSVRD